MVIGITDSEEAHQLLKIKMWIEKGDDASVVQEDDQIKVTNLVINHYDPKNDGNIMVSASSTNTTKSTIINKKAWRRGRLKPSTDNYSLKIYY